LLGLLFLLGKGGSLNRTVPSVATKGPGTPQALPEGDRAWFAVWTGFHWVGPSALTPRAAEALWTAEFDKARKNPKANANLVKLYRYFVGKGWMQQQGGTATSTAAGVANQV
jgi:hypothetical protein